MKPKIQPSGAKQRNFYKVLLVDLVWPSHPLVRLADAINWQEFDDFLGSGFCPDAGRSALSSRLMVGLLYLQYTYDLSDKAVAERWLESPYFQYFCGGVYFEHELPFDTSSLTRWRQRLDDSGAEQMLAASIKAGLKEGFIRKSDLKRVAVDTTVAEKFIRFPTDARLYDRMRTKLVTAARDRGIKLRQSYSRVGPKALIRVSGYYKARQFKRAKKQTSRLKTLLGRVSRDIRRKAEEFDGDLQHLLELSDRLLAQQRQSKNKLYSIHEPFAECIAKGKAHKRYEFGCKVGITSSAKSNWILGAMAFHGNPYDGHTLAQCLEQSERLGGEKHELAVCDLGYRKHNYEGGCDVQIVNRYRKRIPAAMRRWWKRRSAIEPVIGHVKSDHRLDRNRLKGKLGDRLGVLLSASGFNMKKMLRAYAQGVFSLLKRLFAQQIHCYGCLNLK